MKSKLTSLLKYIEEAKEFLKKAEDIEKLIDSLRGIS